MSGTGMCSWKVFGTLWLPAKRLTAFFFKIYFCLFLFFNFTRDINVLKSGRTRKIIATETIQQNWKVKNRTFRSFILIHLVVEKNEGKMKERTVKNQPPLNTDHAKFLTLRKAQKLLRGQIFTENNSFGSNIISKSFRLKISTCLQISIFMLSSQIYTVFV